MDGHRQVLKSAQVTHKVEELLTERAWEKDYADRKGKAKNPDKIQPKDRSTFPQHVFNPGSGPQTQVLLYEIMGLPVLERTRTGQPAVGGDVLEALVNHTTNQEYQDVLHALVGYNEAKKILSTFIAPFEAGMDKGDGRQWLHGCFKFGPVSGRLSSSDPNMQNLPSGSTYGKLVKKIFQAPPGWIFVGADFASLEDRINALLTKDPNKLKVYTDGFDGHALRAVYYWRDQFPDIDPDVPEQVNQLKHEDHPLRGKSKGPTFAMTYEGDDSTLVKKFGFSKTEAKAIFANYNQLYAVSKQWVADRIQQACQDGYATAAFGLRIRTPLLSKIFKLGHRTTPREAEAEARSLGNAISGQSYGLLNNRAMNATMERVWESEFRFDILPCAMIHDACYFLVRDNIDALKWLNDALVEEMSWQELPEIQHDLVKLGAELDVFYPSWAEPITLPNGSSREEIHAQCVDHLRALSEKELAA